MATYRYSEPEMDQWQAACSDAQSSADRTTRSTPAHTAASKGQGERSQARRTQSPSQQDSGRQDEWASECLFDCYNG